MQKVEKVLYYADDGTPFEENRTACEIYEQLCARYRKLLVRGDIMFWDHCENYLNFKFYEYTYNDSTGSYLDNLLKTLKTSCGYFIINEVPGGMTLDDVWEYLSKACCIGDFDLKRLKADYQFGDLIAFEQQDCRFHNFSLVARRTSEIEKRIKIKVANEALKHKTVLEELRND
jgi:hypothetical protein